MHRGQGRTPAGALARPLRGTVLLVESDEPIARIAARELRARRVIWVNAIAKAWRTLDKTPDIDTLVTAYHLRDGTARKLLSLVPRRWPHVRTILYVETALLAGATAKLAASMADVVMTDFAELRRAID
jgi:hypothetical protein